MPADYGQELGEVIDTPIGHMYLRVDGAISDSVEIETGSEDGGALVAPQPFKLELTIPLSKGCKSEELAKRDHKLQHIQRERSSFFNSGLSSANGAEYLKKGDNITAIKIPVSLRFVEEMANGASSALPREERHTSENYFNLIANLLRRLPALPEIGPEGGQTL